MIGSYVQPARNSSNRDYMGGLSPLKKALGPPLHENRSLRRVFLLLVILKLRFDAIFSLSEVRLIRTSFSPPFEAPWNPLCSKITA